MNNRKSENDRIKDLVEKPFLTTGKQIALLKSRNLNIKETKEIKQIKKFFLENNYYRISGYTLSMRKNDIFNKDVSFDDVINVYNFDMKFRSVVLFFLEIVEIKFKSIYIYEFSKKYGQIGYADKKNFTNEELYSKIISKVAYSKEKRIRYEKYLKHYRDYSNKKPIPFWVIIELFSLSDISILYSISHKKLKTRVSKVMGLKFKPAYNTLKNYLDWLVMLRNICAHGGRLYNRGFPGYPRIQNFEKNTIDFAIVDENETPFFGYMFIFKNLLDNDSFQKFKFEIMKLEKETTKYGMYCDLKYYGFPKNWKDIV